MRSEIVQGKAGADSAVLVHRKVDLPARRSGWHTIPAMLIAAIDQGSTRTKGVLVDAGERVVSVAEREVAQQVDGVRVEHDPDDLLSGVCDVLAELCRAGRPDAVALACQRSTCLIWERATGRPLTPAVSWQDRRAAPLAAALRDQAAEVARRTGLRLSPHYAAPKLAGLLAALPHGLERARDRELTAGTLDAFLVRRLAGVAATEPGHAGRTLLYDLQRDAWDPWLCELFGVPAEALPALRPSAGAWGEVEGVPLLAVLGDQQAALLGHGGWEEGVVAVHFGTGAFVLAATGERLLRHDGLLTAVLAATPETRRFQLEASVNSAGSAVDWACRLTGERIQDWQDRALDPELLPLVLPAFTGAAAPWWRPEASGVVAGLGLATSGADLVGGVLAGIAMRVLDGVEALKDAGVAVRVLRLSGKLAGLSGLSGLLADAGGFQVEVAAAEETGLLGASRLAFAVLTGGEPSAAAPPIRSRRDPRWPPERSRAARERWRAFAAAALDLPGPIA
jgi:glycerol kinase